MHDAAYRLERLLFNLDSLAELAEELTSPKDFYRIVRSSLYMIMGNFSASKGAIFQFNRKEKTIHPIAFKGIGNITNLAIHLSDEDIGKLTGVKTALNMKINEHAASTAGKWMAELKKINARLAIPLVMSEDFLGLIAVGEKFTGEDYTKDDMRLLSVMAHHIAVSLHSQSLLQKLMHKYDENRKLYEDLTRIYYDTIHAFATAIDAKDSYTKGHSHRVSAYCAAIAKEMGWPSDEVEGIRVAGLLHDIGKIAIDKSIINKDNPLTKNEYVELNSHPVIGYEILSKVKFPWADMAKMARHHHERVDGRGYPDSLQGGEIALGAKIMSVADSFDAMTTDRPYRPALTIHKTLTELRENCGRQFDRDVVTSLLSILRREIDEEEKPIIMPFLSERFAHELKNETLKGYLI